jgi:hypothetical protein
MASVDPMAKGYTLGWLLIALLVVDLATFLTSRREIKQVRLNTPVCKIIIVSTSTGPNWLPSHPFRH